MTSTFCRRAEPPLWRAEDAIAAMLATASDGRFDAPRAVAQMLLAAVHGTVRTYYERHMPPAIGGEVASQLTLMCRAYLMAARSL